jgi:hypothetical protein
MDMPNDLNYSLYFNLLFVLIIGSGILFGYIKGYKKTAYWFFVMLAYYVFFFLTLNWATKQFFEMRLPLLGQGLELFMPELENVRSLKDAIPIILETYLRDSIGEAVSNEEFIAFVSGVSLFVVKIIYAIIYFTIFKWIYKLIFFIIRVSFVKVDKEEPKRRELGMAFGFMRSVLSVFVMIIILGGVMSTQEQILKLISEEEVELETDSYQKMVDDYNHNLVVRLSNKIQVKDQDTNAKVPLNLYLFDSVFSFEYREEQVALRRDLAIAVEISLIYQNSEYYQTEDLSDLKGDEIRSIFNYLSQSDLLPAIMPLSIEMASEHYETDLNVSKEDLYEIDWRKEINQIGEVTAVTFDFLNAAGALEKDANLDTVTLNGEDVKGVFDSLSESELATLSAYVALEPVLKEVGGNAQAIITVPEDVVFEEEFKAFGLIANEVLKSEITLGDMKSGEPSTIVSIISEVDFTVMLESKIVSHALVNIFSGQAEVDEFDVLEVPEGIVWFDEVDDNDHIVNEGELRKILVALNTITPIANNLDLESLDLKIISEFTDEDITVLYESRVLSATISTLLLDMDLGDTPLVVSDNAYDEAYIKQTELKALTLSAKLLYTRLSCDAGGTCEAGDFNPSKVFQLTESEIDELLDSMIIAHTMGDLINDKAGEELIIPSTVMATIQVEAVDKQVITKDEIKALFLAGSTLALDDIENIDLNASIIQELAQEEHEDVLDDAKANRIFNSVIIHATLSDVLLDLTSDDLVIPNQSIQLEEVRYTDTDQIQYVSVDELKAVLQATLVLDIDEFDEMTSIKLAKIIDHFNTLIDSAIIHATISNQVLDLEDNVLIVPIYTQDGALEENRIQVEVDTTTYIVAGEIEKLVNALKLMEYEDLNNFGTTIDSQKFFDSREQLLESASIQATISNKLLTETNGKLIVPDAVFGTAEPIRIQMTDITYVEIGEIKHILDALENLNLKQFNTMEFEATNVLDADINLLLHSYSIQATISDLILEHALDETAPNGTQQLIVPSTLREAITVAEANALQIEKIELNYLLHSLKQLEVSDFSGDMNTSKSKITSMTDPELDTLLNSGSIHITTDNMIKGNPNVQVPDLAKDVLHQIPDITIKPEVIKFIRATNILSSSDFTTTSFDATTIMSLDETSQDLVLSSMIVRNSVTDEFEAIVDADPTYSIDQNYYEGQDETSFLTKAGIIAIIKREPLGQ